MKSRDDKPPRAWNSTIARRTKGIERTPLTGPVGPTRKPIAKVGKQKAKREARNREYYASAEWRAKRKAVFERDGYRCTEIVTHCDWRGSEIERWQERCPTYGEIVNGKQTARGLVAEEQGYFHRGNAESIARIVTRCKDCDRRLTPLERANHANGFNNGRKAL